MPDVIKAYVDDGRPLLEVSTTAVSDKGARARSITYLMRLERNVRPSVASTESLSLEDGRMKEYRVLLELDDVKDLKDVVSRIPEVSITDL